MSYEDIRIEGSLTEAMEAWVGSRYGKVVDIELGGINEINFAAVGYAAVENAETGTVDAVILLLQHDPKAGSDQYRIKDMAEIEGPMVDCCPRESSTNLRPPLTFLRWIGESGAETGRQKADEFLRSR